MKDLRLSNN